MEHFLTGMIFTPYEDLDAALSRFINPAYPQVTDGETYEQDRLLEVFETTRKLTGDAEHAELGSAR